MAIKTGSQLSLQGGGKGHSERHMSFAFDGTDATAELPVPFSEIYAAHLTVVNPGSAGTAAANAQDVEVVAGATPSSGTAGSMSATGVITPGKTEGGTDVLTIARNVTASGTLTTDLRVNVHLIGRH